MLATGGRYAYIGASTTRAALVGCTDSFGGQASFIGIIDNNKAFGISTIADGYVSTNYTRSFVVINDGPRILEEERGSADEDLYYYANLTSTGLELFSQKTGEQEWGIAYKELK